MMHYKQNWGFLLACLLAVPLVTSSVTQPVLAKSKDHVKFIWRHKIAKHSYTIRSTKAAKKSYAYSTDLKHKTFKLANYKGRVFKVSYSEKLKVNNKSQIYYYITSASGKKIKGWALKSNIIRTKTQSSKNSQSAPTKSSAPTGQSTSSEATPQVSLSKSELMDKINAAPDLNPGSTILSLTNADYKAYENILAKNYNLNTTVDTGVFKNHHASISVKDNALLGNTNAAITQWNNALGSDVFSLGTKENHTMIIELKNLNGIGGQFGDDTVDVSSNAFNDNKNVTNTPDSAEMQTLRSQEQDILAKKKQLEASHQTDLANLHASYMAQIQQLSNQKANATPDQRNSIQQQIQALIQQQNKEQQSLNTNYNQEIQNLNTQEGAIEKQDASAESDHVSDKHSAEITVILLHELGHALSLDHTPYQDDIMFASSNSDGNQSVKYNWTRAVNPAALSPSTLSQRDINRAKLSEKLGYW